MYLNAFGLSRGFMKNYLSFALIIFVTTYTFNHFLILFRLSNYNYYNYVYYLNMDKEEFFQGNEVSLGTIRH